MALASLCVLARWMVVLSSSVLAGGVCSGPAPRPRPPAAAGHGSARKRQIAEVIDLIAEPAAVVDLLDDVPALLARSVASWSVADHIARRRRHVRHLTQRRCRRRRLA